MDVSTGILVPKTMKSVGAGTSSAQYAIVIIGGTSFRCVVKRVSHAEIAAECICALLGDYLQLPTLPPVVVTDPRDDSLWFGAKEVAHPSLSARLFLSASASPAQLKALATILGSWGALGSAIAFDELIANEDRNPGNVLWNGAEFSLIDHSRSLGLYKKIFNKLALFATENFSHSLITALEPKARAAALAHQAMLIGGLIWDDVQVNKMSVIAVDITTHVAGLIASAIGRQAHLPTLTANAFSPLFAGKP